MPAASRRTRRTRRTQRHGQFNLLGLPRELRDDIYELTLPATLEVDFGRAGFQSKYETSPKKTSSIWESDIEKKCDKLKSTALVPQHSSRLKQYPLLLVSKQVNFEYSASIVRCGKPKFHLSNWMGRQLGEWITSRAILQSIRTFNLEVTFLDVGRSGRKIHSLILDTNDKLERNLRLLIAGMTSLRRIVFEVNRGGTAGSSRWARGIHMVHETLLASIATRPSIELEVLYVAEFHWSSLKKTSAQAE